MEPKKIRIGNDIRLAVDLRLYIGNPYLKERDVYSLRDKEFELIDSNDFVNKKYELYYPNEDTYQTTSDEDSSFSPDYTPVNIKSVKALLINTTIQEKNLEDLEKKTRFISRFPMEPRFGMYHSTPYDICCSGYHSWRVYPGFGVNPRFDALYKPAIGPKPAEYVANVMATYKPNVVEVVFPAEHQFYIGKYKLVLVIKLFVPGFNNQNLRTITIDVPDVFELVKTTDEGSDTGFIINITDISDKLPDPDVYVDRGNVNMNTLTLGRTDDSTIDIDLSSITDWYDID